MTIGQPLLEMDQVGKSFRVVGGALFHVVKSVSLTVPAGEIVALVGESGSGKSTLGRIALGLMAPDTGSVSFDGQGLACPAAPSVTCARECSRSSRIRPPR